MIQELDLDNKRAPHQVVKTHLLLTLPCFRKLELEIYVVFSFPPPHSCGSSLGMSSVRVVEHHEPHSSEEVSSRRRAPTHRQTHTHTHTRHDNNNNNLGAGVYSVTRRANCASAEPSQAFFPLTLSLMKVASSPGGPWSTVCLCLREREVERA